MMRSTWQVRISQDWWDSHTRDLVGLWNLDQLSRETAPFEDDDRVTFSELARTYQPGAWDRLIWSNHPKEN